MKKELIEFLEKHPLFKYELDGGSEQQVKRALDEFFDQYQPERSKREDLDFDKRCLEFMNDIYESKMRCSEH